MTKVSTSAVLEQLDETDNQYAEVLAEEALTVEIGRHAPGTAEPKNPHTEDELYYIVSGTGKIRVGDDVHAVTAGDTIFVEKGLEHDFFDIEEELVTLVIFVDSSDPASYSIRE